LIKKNLKLNILIIFFSVYKKSYINHYLEPKFFNFFNKNAFNLDQLNFYKIINLQIIKFYLNKKKYISLNKKNTISNKNLIIYKKLKNQNFLDSLSLKSINKYIKFKNFKINKHFFYNQNKNYKINYDLYNKKHKKYQNFIFNYTIQSNFNKNNEIFFKNVEKFLNEFSNNNFNENKLKINLSFLLFKQINNINVKNNYYYNISYNLYKLDYIYTYIFNIKIQLKQLNFKKSLTTVKYLLKYFTVVNDFFLKKTFYFFISNKYLINYLNFFDLDQLQLFKNNNLLLNKTRSYTFNNYYPILFLKTKSYDSFFLNLKFNYNLNYLSLTNKIIVSFLENLLKKNVFIKITSNRFNKLENYYLNSLLVEYKNFQPQYFKNFLFYDFLNIL
jgi:hypothetical protein